jgi:hypothetical protein
VEAGGKTLSIAKYARLLIAFERIFVQVAGKVQWKVGGLAILARGKRKRKILSTIGQRLSYPCWQNGACEQFGMAW